MWLSQGINYFNFSLSLSLCSDGVELCLKNWVVFFFFILSTLLYGIKVRLFFLSSFSKGWNKVLYCLHLFVWSINVCLLCLCMGILRFGRSNSFCQLTTTSKTSWFLYQSLKLIRNSDVTREFPSVVKEKYMRVVYDTWHTYLDKWNT